MGDLSREQILNVKDIHRIEVDVPEWGGSVYLAPLDVKRRDEMMAGLRDADTDDLSALRLRLFVAKMIGHKMQKHYT